jgi:hypothetical protein
MDKVLNGSVHFLHARAACPARTQMRSDFRRAAFFEFAVGRHQQFLIGRMYVIRLHGLLPVCPA